MEKLTQDDIIKLSILDPTVDACLQTYRRACGDISWQETLHAMVTHLVNDKNAAQEKLIKYAEKYGSLNDAKG